MSGAFTSPIVGCEIHLVAKTLISCSSRRVATLAHFTDEKTEALGSHREIAHSPIHRGLGAPPCRKLQPQTSRRPGSWRAWECLPSRAGNTEQHALRSYVIAPLAFLCEGCPSFWAQPLPTVGAGRAPAAHTVKEVAALSDGRQRQQFAWGFDTVARLPSHMRAGCGESSDLNTEAGLGLSCELPGAERKILPDFGEDPHSLRKSPPP